MLLALETFVAPVASLGPLFILLFQGFLIVNMPLGAVALKEVSVGLELFATAFGLAVGPGRFFGTKEP